MVTINPNVSSRTDVIGYVEERATVPPTSLLAEEYPFPSFWGSIFAGSFVALAIGMLSECLMVGCRVGVYTNGVAVSGGAVAWMLITTCIAYFFGGWVSSQLSVRSSWTRGFALWAFTIVFGIALAALFAGGLAAVGTHTAAINDQMTSYRGSGMYGNNMYMAFHGAWAGFVMLALGLIFSVLGSSMPSGGERAATGSATA